MHCRLSTFSSRLTIGSTSTRLGFQPGSHVEAAQDEGGEEYKYGFI